MRGGELRILQPILGAGLHDDVHVSGIGRPRQNIFAASAAYRNIYRVCISDGIRRL